MSPFNRLEDLFLICSKSLVGITGDHNFFWQQDGENSCEWNVVGQSEEQLVTRVFFISLFLSEGRALSSGQWDSSALSDKVWVEVFFVYVVVHSSNLILNLGLHSEFFSHSYWLLVVCSTNYKLESWSLGNSVITWIGDTIAHSACTSLEIFIRCNLYNFWESHFSIKIFARDVLVISRHNVWHHDHDSVVIINTLGERVGKSEWNCVQSWYLNKVNARLETWNGFWGGQLARLELTCINNTTTCQDMIG